jgi:hypothetical protein
MIEDGVRSHKAGKRKVAAAQKLNDSEAVMNLRAQQALDDSLEPAPLDPTPELPMLATAALLPTFNLTVQSLGEI